eukprot:2684289-Rhodomonas_salina.2
MPVQGMPGPASIQPVLRASSLERAVLFKVCPAMTHARTPAICSCMVCDEGLKKAFKVVVLVALGSPSSHHLIVFESVATCKLEDDNPGLCPGGGVRVSDDDAVSLLGPVKPRAGHESVLKCVHSSLTEFALGQPRATLVSRDHCGRRKAEATGLKEVMNSKLRECGVRQDATQDLPPVVLPEREVSTQLIRKVLQPLSLFLSNKPFGMLVHCSVGVQVAACRRGNEEESVDWSAIGKSSLSGLASWIGGSKLQSRRGRPRQGLGVHIVIRSHCLAALFPAIHQ